MTWNFDTDAIDHEIFTTVKETCPIGRVEQFHITNRDIRTFAEIEHL